VILVTFAVPFESAAFRKRAISREVRILHTGVGAESARAALEIAVTSELPERVIAAGFAGAVAPGLQVGQIVRTGLVSVAEVLATVQSKRDFHAQTGAAAVDMETEAICEVCAIAGVPVVTLRAISDSADDDLGLPADLLEGLTRFAPAAWLRAGWQLCCDRETRHAFQRLVRNCRIAQSALADALEEELSR
jgi:nucleoside phosphorylase